MSIIDTTCVLVPNTKYKVQEVSKFPKDKSYLIGQNVIFMKIEGTNAHVRSTGGNMMVIPTRSLINIVGYTAKGVRGKNADGFAVVAQNNLGLAVGTAILDPFTIEKEHFTAIVNNRTLYIPNDIVCALVKTKRKDDKDSQKVKSTSKQTGVSEAVVSSLDDAVAPQTNREDIDKLPYYVQKLLPETNVQVLIDYLKNTSDVFSDYEGNVHSTIAEADVANTKIRYKRLQVKLTELMNVRLEKDFEAIESEH